MLELLNNLPHWFATTLIAATPVLELRASIPVALGVYKMPLAAAVLWSVIGDMIPAIFLLLFVARVSDFARARSRVADRFFTWWFSSTEKKFSASLAKYGLIALFIFVAVPLPGTGSWSGAVAAFLFRLPFLGSLLAIFAGIVVAATLVAAASAGILAIF